MALERTSAQRIPWESADRPNTDLVMTENLVNYAAALARAIAMPRGRNAAWAEQAARESVSVTAEEALALGVIDLMANDFEELLRQIDGRRVMTSVGEVTLLTAEAQVVEGPMTLAERVLQTIADPNIAYILLTIGIIGIIAELYDPGALFPGIVGAISLILAFVAFGNLPLNWAGVLLILLATGLFVAEGQRQAAILEAEGARQASILRACFEMVSSGLPSLVFGESACHVI